MRSRRRTGGVWRWLLDVGTGLLVVLALALVVHDRVLPELRRLAEVEIGEPIPSEIDYRLLASGEAIPASSGPALHLVFQSTCPACRQNLPRWQEILAARPDVRAYGVGLESPSGALRYARRHLPTALAVRPMEESSYIRTLRIQAVPTTLVTDDRGRLVLRTVGILGPADVEAILGHLDRRSIHEPLEGGERP